MSSDGAAGGAASRAEHSSPPSAISTTDDSLRYWTPADTSADLSFSFGAGAGVSPGAVGAGARGSEGAGGSGGEAGEEEEEEEEEEEDNDDDDEEEHGEDTRAEAGSWGGATARNTPDGHGHEAGRRSGGEGKGEGGAKSEAVPYEVEAFAAAEVGLLLDGKAQPGEGAGASGTSTGVSEGGADKAEMEHGGRMKLEANVDSPVRRGRRRQVADRIRHLCCFGGGGFGP
ncbi:uncharacterized protein FIBRA_08599 [Fibroporia radiculosa]|uniref:Uncharacterized protein n=1 Tax=Fibroporia radiculosa TaxID=599839 RepID=J4H594_9APHY|nr:uncharacterized protein FIBRA_08599 [Fibroporia radiculosa]CCM06344.1 predicted protein [Fibroporia radiculosa]